MKRHGYIKAGRPEEFRKKIDGLARKEVVGVAIDISKDYHRIMIHDLEGEVLREPFEIDTFKTGYETLITEISRVMGEVAGKKLFFVMEPTGPHHVNIARQLEADYGGVYFLNPYQTAENRNQSMLRGLKTDDIDLGAMADLLIRGEAYPFNMEEGLYLNLKEKTYWREKKLKIVTILKNQINARFCKIYPGIFSKYDDNKPLFTDTWDSKISRGLMKIGLTGREIIKLQPRSLRKKFKEVGYSIGRQQSIKIKEYMERMLLPKDEHVRIELQLLKNDVELFEVLEKEMQGIEAEMVAEVKETPARHLLGKIKGLSDIMIASYVGALGKISRFASAKKAFCKSGLSSGRYQTGKVDRKGRPIRRLGSSLLRSIEWKMARTVGMHNPYFGIYLSYLTDVRRKHYKVANIAVGNKLNRVMWAMMRDGTEFNPPTAKIDYISALFKQEKKKRKEQRLVEKEKRREACKTPDPHHIALKGHSGLLSQASLPRRNYN